MGNGTAPYGSEIVAFKKRVLYEGTDTIYEGMALCYNQDTTDNILGYDKGAGGHPEAQTTPTTTAEGYQNEGKFLRVEKPAAANIPFFAGVVAPGSWCGTTGDGATDLDIFIPNGAIVPVRGTDSFTIGDPIYLAAADYEFTNVPQVGGYCGVAMETVDRSSTEGLLLAVLRQTRLTENLVTSSTQTQAATPIAVTAAMNGYLFDNDGATGAIEFDLPAAADATGCQYTFTVKAAQNIAIDPDGTEVIVFGNDEDVLGAGEALTLTPADTNDAGMSITLVSDGTQWLTKAAWAPAAAKFVIP